MLVDRGAIGRAARPVTLEPEAFERRIQVFGLEPLLQIDIATDEFLVFRELSRIAILLDQEIIGERIERLLERQSCEFLFEGGIGCA